MTAWPGALEPIMLGVVMAKGRRTVTSWLRSGPQKGLAGLLLLSRRRRPGQRVHGHAAVAVAGPPLAAGGASRLRHRRHTNQTLRSQS